MPKYINKFKNTVYREETIVNSDTDAVIGHIRIKPSSILWKQAGESDYYSVTLDQFVSWITEYSPKSKRTKQ